MHLLCPRRILRFDSVKSQNLDTYECRQRDENGVDDEQVRGTGIVASALAAYVSEAAPAVSIRMGGLRNYNYCVQARRDELSVDFNTGLEGWLASDVHLTGPAELVEEIEI